eukprot:Sdes_comp17803_c0_seq2m7067
MKGKNSKSESLKTPDTKPQIQIPPIHSSDGQIISLVKQTLDMPLGANEHKQIFNLATFLKQEVASTFLPPSLSHPTATNSTPGFNPAQVETPPPSKMISFPLVNNNPSTYALPPVSAAPPQEYVHGLSSNQTGSVFSQLQEAVDKLKKYTVLAVAVNQAMKNRCEVTRELCQNLRKRSKLLQIRFTTISKRISEVDIPESLKSELESYQSFCQLAIRRIESVKPELITHLEKLKRIVVFSFVQFRKSGIVAKIQSSISPTEFNSLKPFISRGDDAVRDILKLNIPQLVLEKDNPTPLVDSDFSSDLIYDLPNLLTPFMTVENSPLQKYFKTPEFVQFFNSLKQILTASVRNVSDDVSATSDAAKMKKNHHSDVQFPISPHILNSLKPIPVLPDPLKPSNVSKSSPSLPPP